MAIGSNSGVEFNLSNIQDNQVLVYDAAQGVFINETAAVSANASVTGEGRNVGSTGVGLYKQNDSNYLEFYKIDAGSNVTLSLNDNVLTIDAVVGAGTTTLSTGTANSIVTYDSTGNVATGTAALTFDGTTLTHTGASQNVTTANGVVTANGLVTTNLTVGTQVFPTADGSGGQVLKTDGAGALSWTNPTSIAGLLSSTLFNAHIASAITTTASHQPALDVIYSLGNTTNRYSQVFSEYFRGQADTAANAINLGSLPSSAYRLTADSYTETEVDNLIANISIPDISNVLSNITVTNNSVSYVHEDGKVDLRSSDGSIGIAPDTAGKYVDLTYQDTSYKFTRFCADGDTGNYVVAENSTDVLNFVGGTGINVTANPNTDTLTITAEGGAAANISGSSIADLADVSTIGSITNGQALIWSTANSTFEPGTVASSGVALTDLSVTSASASGNGSLTYNNSTGVFTFTPADLTQSLSWNSGTSTLSISGGNSIDLSALVNTDTDTQDLSISGNVISLVNGGTVDITSAIASGGGTTTIAGLTDTAISGPTSGQVLKWNGSAWANATDANTDTDTQDLSISGNVISLTSGGTVDLTTALASVTSDYGDSNVSTYLGAQGYATQATIVAAITDSAPATLDTLNELASALGDDANFSTTITNSIATKADSSSLSTVATSGLFNDLTSRPAISLSGSDLTYDGTTLDLTGLGATGPQGATGPTGAAGTNGTNGTNGVDGQTISSGAVSSGTLTLTMNDASTVTVSGSVTGATGPAGSNGTNGNGITSVALSGDNLVLTYSNTSVQDMGSIRGDAGPQGATGPAGTNGTNGTNGTDGNDGADGTDGIALTDLSISTASASGSGSLTYAGGTGVFTFTPPDLSSYITSETDSQTLSLAGNTLSITGGNNVDLSSVGGASTLDALTDVSTSGVSSGQVLKYNGTSWAPAADNNSGGGGGGSGTSYEYFKVYYTSAGAIDTTQGTGGISDKSSNMGTITVNNAASNSCEISLDFASNYSYPPLGITAYGYSQSTSEYNIKSMIQNLVNTTLKLDGTGNPHGSLGTKEITMSLTRSETGSSSSFGQSSHAWIYFVMGS
ncbi:hypothetical protein N9O93_01030 [bacterium]|nr:hypothetical protein [Hellea sp.]MDA9047681.1 hypothetical protein [Hellea sp.]MDA9225254.1 hypothetical protein [bacterium]